jgi:hypothetical protein
MLTQAAGPGLCPAERQSPRQAQEDIALTTVCAPGVITLSNFRAQYLHFTSCFVVGALKSILNVHMPFYDSAAESKTANDNSTAVKGCDHIRDPTVHPHISESHPFR